MSKDNENLIEEKNRLNNLLATQQSLENERNMSDSESRRKAQGKIETLERELSDVQRRLSNETEESKKLQLRKEYEGKEAQKRIDELMTSLGQIREEHVAVKTTRDHLQARVDELTVELRNAEEKVGRLQPRPTPRPGLGTDGNQRQQELEAELHELNSDISDLKRDLDIANTQLENAKAQAEQYKELSQGNEELLADLRESQEQYRLEMDAIIEEKDSKIKELSQRIDDMSEELSRSNTELSQLRDSQGDVARKYEDEKGILEDELKRLKEDSARHAEEARYHQQDLRAQAEIASKAQQDYEKELVKHAEAAKLVQQLRTQYNQLKSESASLRAEADSAKVTLAQNESSWADRQQRLEQEMTELVARREDVNAQNKLLHQQLEGLTAQVAALQQSRSNGKEDGDEGMSPVNVGDALEGLRELNSYLRREKEILEVQYDLKSQESKRLQQQVEYIQSQLDESRLKLDQERTQSAQSGRTSMTHQNLMEKLNELNLYRESSAALRNENSQLKDQIAEKMKRIEEMEGKVQPLEAEIDNLSTQKSYLEDEIKQIQEDRDRWQKRTEGILTKYGRVDPAEMEQLKKTITDLETERDGLRQGEQPLREKITELETTLESERQAWQTTRGKLTEQFKDRSRKLTGERTEAAQRANQLQEQLDKATGDLQEARQLAENAEKEKSELEQQVQTFKQQVDELRHHAQQLQPAEPAAQAVTPIVQPGEATVSAEVVNQLEQNLADARKELEAVNAQKLGAQQQLEQLRAELQKAVSERDEAIHKLQNAEPVQTNGTADDNAPPPATADAAASGLSDEERTALEEKVAAAEAKAAEFEQRADEVENKIQQTIKERSDRMRDTLNNKLKESRVKMEDEFKRKEEDLKLHLEQEKLIWQAENKGEKATTTAEPPSTPAKSEEQQPAATPSTPAGPPDLSQLDDSSIRQFLSTNATVKSIIAANIKKKLELENARIKSEYETKISSAREQAQLMESKKSTLRINMAENKLKSASAKLGVVEIAANQTPQRPVGEVWAVAKVAQPSAAPSAPGTPARGAPAAKQPATPATKAPASGAVTPAAQQQPAQTTPSVAKPAVGGVPTPKTASNPFAVTADATKPGGPNPFAVTPESAGAPETQAQQQPAPAQQQGQQVPQAQQAQQAQQQQPQPQPQPGQQGQQVPPVRSGIPMPRGGGGRGRGGAYVPPGHRGASGNQEGGAAGQGGRGRGGHRGGRGNMNPGATDFQPGAKRPRGDSEVGGGAKRARGAH
jgi:nucleoprotein TPR